MIWAFIFFIALLIYSTRNAKLLRSLGGVIKSLFVGKLLVVNLSALLYIVIWIFFLYRIDLWDMALLKKTVIWFLGAAMVLVFKTGHAGEPHYFRKRLRSLIEWGIIAEFIEGFYSFPLWIELILIPFVLFMVGLSVFSKDEEKYRDINSCTNSIIKWVAVAVFFISLYESLVHWRLSFNEDHLKDILLAPVMTLLFLPYLYLLAIYMGYEILYLRLSFQTRGKPNLFRLAKHRLRRACGLNLIKLNLAKEGLLHIDLDDHADFQQFLDNISTRARK